MPGDCFCLDTQRYTAKRSSAPHSAEIVRVGGHYTVQGHSRSLILVPSETPYAISYYPIQSNEFGRAQDVLYARIFTIKQSNTIQ